MIGDNIQAKQPLNFDNDCGFRHIQTSMVQVRRAAAAESDLKINLFHVLLA